MPRQPTPMQETEAATALHDSGDWEVPDKPMSDETAQWLKEELHRKNPKIRFDAPSHQKSAAGSLNGERNTLAAPAKTSQPSFAASSKGLLALKQELLARGMSDDEAEDYLRTI